MIIYDISMAVHQYMPVYNNNMEKRPVLTVERDYHSGHETHKTLLGNGIIILEGLKLADIEEGVYQLIALPLKIIGTEAAPARVILIKK